MNSKELQFRRHLIASSAWSSKQIQADNIYITILSSLGAHTDITHSNVAKNSVVIVMIFNFIFKCLFVFLLHSLFLKLEPFMIYSHLWFTAHLKSFNYKLIKSICLTSGGLWLIFTIIHIFKRNIKNQSNNQIWARKSARDSLLLILKLRKGRISSTL